MKHSDSLMLRRENVDRGKIEIGQDVGRGKIEIGQDVNRDKT